MAGFFYSTGYYHPAPCKQLPVLAGAVVVFLLFANARCPWKAGALQLPNNFSLSPKP